jgi:hypothetical protein
MNEHAVVFPCEEDALLGIVHAPDQAGTTGVVIIVAGGPQYRVGAHRQFVVLGRELARQGIPVLRFDLFAASSTWMPIFEVPSTRFSHNVAT